MYLLLNWLSEDNNFHRFKYKGSYKRDMAEGIEQYFINNGITWRNAHAIQSKVENLETQWQKANGICTGTGGGVCDAALELKRLYGWDDDSPEWVREKKVAFECKYYFGLEPIFATRHGNTRLAVSHNLASKTEDEDASGPERECDPLEDSPNSNLAYQDLQEDIQNNSQCVQEDLLNNSQCETLHHSLNLDLSHYDNHQEYSDSLMERLVQMVDEDEHGQPHIPSAVLTQMPYCCPTTSSTPLKQTASRNSLQSNAQSTHGKRFKKGVTSQVQDLVQSQKLSRGGCGSALVEPRNQVMEDNIISRQEVKFDCICDMADTLANMFPQAQKSVLDKTQEKKKAEIEQKTAQVVLQGEKEKLDLYDFDLNVK